MRDHNVEKYRNGNHPKPKLVNLFDVISDSINLSQNKLADIYIEKYKPDLVVVIPYEMASLFDVYKSEELIEAGRVACRKALDAAAATKIVTVSN